MLIIGPTQSGKTEFLIKLLENRSTLIHPVPTRIIWAYGLRNENQMMKIENAIPNIEFIEGLPNIDDINENDTNLLVLDDLMEELGKSPEMSKLFTRGSHHRNITIIAIMHNLFNQDRFMRTITLNTHYFILFKSPRDNKQIKYFGSQIFPQNPKFISEAFKQATSKPYGYLILDLRPNTPDLARVSSGILPNEIPEVYTPL